MQSIMHRILKRSNLIVAEFFKKHRLYPKHRKILSEGGTEWRRPDKKILMLSLASKQKHKNCKHSTLGLKFSKSPCASTENDSYKLTLEHRKKGRKDIMNLMKITARKRMKVLQLVQANAIKGSVGWFLRFFKRKKIKFRERKSKKKYDGEEKLNK